MNELNQAQTSKNMTSMDNAFYMRNEYCTIDMPSYLSVLDAYGKYYSAYSKIPASKIASDVLDPNKPIMNGELLSEHVNLNGKRILEIGAGFGVNLIVWTKKYGADYTGVEPDSEGFEASFKIAKRLLEMNNINPQKMINAMGERLPFESNSFDVVYSSNMLEHCSNPYQVLKESMRVLRPDGIMHMVYPNYLSYFEGHYAVFHPPILWKHALPFYLKFFLNRKPDFSETLRTQLNPIWTRNALNNLSSIYDFRLISLGEEVFLQRMDRLNFETWAGLHILKSALLKLKKLRLNRIAGKAIVLLRGWTPIILTVQKK